MLLDTKNGQNLSLKGKNPLPSDWMDVLGEEFLKDYMVNLRAFLAAEISQKKILYPHGKDIFSAFDLTPFQKVKVIIIGQDPYHGPGQAHGLSFSVRPGVRVPPSLQNIYKELESDLGIKPVCHGYLESWAKEGVLMLNNVLTVEKSKAGSHQNKGWEHFTDKVVEILNEQKENLVFLLWGAHAQRKGEKLNRKRHLVLESPHPSPFSAHRGFLGNKHFSKVNLYLDKMGLKKVDWSLPEHVSDHI
ncbi:MAG: uracil-DNA glycosylase [Bdellovibrionota bacterium]|nr:uracil-DNA glycosylase [Bdellovibrionota bacterium]